MSVDKQSIKKMISTVLGIPLEGVEDDLAVGDVPEWDSLGHLRLLSSLESEFGITLDIEQTLEIEDVEDIVDVILGHQ